MMSDVIIHNLKCIDRYFDAMKSGALNFDVRVNDHAYQTGDLVRMRRFFGKEAPDYKRNLYDDHAEPLMFRIGWILQGGQFGIEPNTCVFSLLPVDEAKS